MTPTPVHPTELGNVPGPLLVDVRTPSEFETAHIPGSVNVPLDTLEAHAAEAAAVVSQNAVLVCRSGARAAQAQEALAAHGRYLQTLQGGVVEWQAHDGELTRGRERWDLERQVRLVAGGIVALSGLASLVAPRARWVGTAVGGGLVAAAATNTCAMGTALSKLPHNQVGELTWTDVAARLRGA